MNIRPLTVVAAVLISPKNKILLAQRPIGKPYAGYWEFPGGKVEINENLTDGLARELSEELGIQSTDPADFTHWKTVQHPYPHALVELHIFLCRQWQGEPAGREGQTLVWQNPIEVQPILPATLPLLPELLRTIHALSC